MVDASTGLAVPYLSVASNSIVTIVSSDLTQVGVHQLKIKAYYLGELINDIPLARADTFQLTIFRPNLFAPQFTSPLVTLYTTQLQDIAYVFPSTYDGDTDGVIISAPSL